MEEDDSFLEQATPEVLIKNVKHAGAFDKLREVLAKELENSVWLLPRPLSRFTRKKSISFCARKDHHTPNQVQRSHGYSYLLSANT